MSNFPDPNAQFAKKWHPPDHGGEPGLHVSLSGLSFQLTSPPGTASKNLTLIFNLSAAPTADFPVTLSSTPPVDLPGAVTIPAGSTKYEIPVPFPPMGPPGTIYTVTGTDPNGVTQTANWRPPYQGPLTIQSLVVNNKWGLPALTSQSADFTITLSGPATPDVFVSLELDVSPQAAAHLISCQPRQWARIFPNSNLGVFSIVCAPMVGYSKITVDVYATLGAAAPVHATAIFGEA